MAISQPYCFPMYSPYASLRVAAAITVASDDEIWDDIIGTNDQLDILVKNVTITLGQRDVTPINTLGFVQVRDFKRSDMTEAKCVLVSSANLDTNIGTPTTHQHLVGYLYGTSVQVTALTEYRLTGGWKASGDRVLKCVVFRTVGHQKNSTTFYTTEQDIVLNNASCSNIEFSHDAEGHQEITLTFKCLAQDTYVEFDAPA